MRWAGHEERVGEERNTACTNILAEKALGTRHLRDPGIDGRILLKPFEDEARLNVI
jgi:hypothetical protein